MRNVTASVAVVNTIFVLIATQVIFAQPVVVEQSDLFQNYIGIGSGSGFRGGITSGSEPGSGSGSGVGFG
jgi:hypothetical protein